MLGPTQPMPVPRPAAADPAVAASSRPSPFEADYPTAKHAKIYVGQSRH